MDGLTIIAVLLSLWGLATMAVAIFQPGFVWNNPKTSGFKSLLGDTGTVIFFIVVGLIATGAGVLILVL
jgi:uncharacterized membrane protein